MNTDQLFDPQPYTINFEDRPDYLYAKIETRHNSPQVLISYWREIAEAVRLRSATRLMVEKGAAPEANTTDAFTVAASLRDMGFEGVSIALVKHPDVPEESNQFVENVARNRGVLMSVFNDTAVAEEWLRMP